MSGATIPVTAPQEEMWQLSASITPFAMALMQSFLQLDSESPGNQLFLHPSLAMKVAEQTSISPGWKRAVTSTSMSSVRRLSLLPTFSISCLVGLLRVLLKDKQTRYAVLVARQQPPVAFQTFAFETFGGLQLPVQRCTGRCGGVLCSA